MNQKLGFFLTVLIQIAIFTRAANQINLRINQFPPHRIRHQRHVVRNLINLFKASEYNQKCDTKPLYSNNQLEECPIKRCTKNHDCWEEYGQSKLCVCDPHLCGLVCMEHDLQCQPPRQPANGYVRYTRLRVGHHVEYTCRPGYAVKGPRKRYCQANLKLSEREPICTDQTDLCFSAPYIPNAQVADGSNREDYRNGEKVNITCQIGFEDHTRAHTTAICMGNEWVFEKIHCEKISCGKIEDPLNGRTMYNNNYTYQSVAIQFCNDGFKINCSLGDQPEEKNCKRICEADRTWSGIRAICTPVLCQELSAPRNGEIIGHWNTVNSIKNFKCNEGYQLSGSHLRKCLHSGDWDGLPAVCNVRNCGSPPQIPFAKVVFNLTTYGAIAEIHCQLGTTLFGKSTTLKCGEVDNNSTWLPRPESQCFRHCTQFTVQNANVFVHDRAQNSDIILHQEVKHQVSVRVKCSYGFELNREEMPLCNNGSWSYKPECIEASCASRPPSMKYSTVRFFSLKHSSIARYYCHSGYRIKYKTNDKIIFQTWIDIRCIKGNWTKTPQEGCQPTRCNKPQTPINGEIYLMGQSDRTRLTDELIKPVHNRVIKYECHPDYRLKGPKIAVCLDGKWSPPESPTCELIMHDELPLSWLYYQSSDRK